MSAPDDDDAATDSGPRTASLAAFDATLDDVEARLLPLLAADRAEYTASLAPLEAAKLNVSLAYAAHSLFYMYLRATGAAAPSQHPVRAELARVQQAYGRVQQRVKDAAEAAPAAAASASAAAAPRLDKAAAGRLISGAMTGDETYRSAEAAASASASASSASTSASPSESKPKPKKRSRHSSDEPASPPAAAAAAAKPKAKRSRDSGPGKGKRQKRGR